MSLKFKKINNEKVKPIVFPEDIEKTKKNKLFDEEFPNIFLCAKKKSGKTSVIFKILKECVSKNTNIVVFCSTVYKDKTWIEIVKYFKKKKIPIITYQSIYDDGYNQVEQLINHLKNTNIEKEDHEKQPIPKQKLILTGFVTEGSKPKKEPIQDYIVIFDDLGNEIGDPYVSQFLKVNRHLRCKNVLSSQFLTDIKPVARKQIDIWILFGGHSIEKLEMVYKDADLNIEFDEFLKIYKEVTKDKFNFLYIDSVNSEFRKNFDSQIII